MKKRIPGSVILSILVLLISFNPLSAESLKTETLEKKIYEISSLRAKIVDKIDQAVEMRIRLERHLAELQEEIQSERSRLGIYSHTQALQNLRIRYNLNLIQVLQAYELRLNERIDYFQNGNEHLKFFVQQIKDDMAIISTLKDLEIDNLMDRINRVLDELITETKKPVFNVSDIRMLPIECIWDEITMYSDG